MNKQKFTNLVKQKCHEIGFTKSGIAKVDYFKEDKKYLIDWLDKNYNGSMKWMEKDIDKRTNISNYYSDSKLAFLRHGISKKFRVKKGGTSDSYVDPYLNFSIFKKITDSGDVCEAAKFLFNDLKKVPILYSGNQTVPKERQVERAKQSSVRNIILEYYTEAVDYMVTNPRVVSTKKYNFAPIIPPTAA